MKKIKRGVVIAIVFAVLAFCLCACGSTNGGSGTDPDGTGGDGTLQQFVGVTLADGTFTYDGTAHSLAVSGNVPAGTNVSYQNNGKTDVGTYTVTATLSKDGYEEKTLSATLTINKAQFTGVTLADGTFTYDGAAHSLAVANAPAGTNISYQNNGKTDAGTYTVTATLSKDGYEEKTLSATLTINKAQFVGVTLENKKFVNLGGTYSLTLGGAELPQGTQVSWQNNGKSEVGEYTVTATLTNPNYETKTLSAKLTVIAKMEIATTIVNSLLNKPDPWSFLPDAFAPEEMAYAQTPVGGFDGFAASVQVSQIAKRSIGKQFNVLYEGLCDAAAAINKIDAVYSMGATIANAYQTFINDNPDDYAEFTGNVGGFKIKIALDGEKSSLLAGNSTVSIELAYDGETEIRTGRVQLTDGVAVKYTSSENSLKFAVKTTVGGVGNLKQIEFVRNGGAVAGYLREFTGTETKHLKTTGVIASNAQTTVIMSDKREKEDMKINGYEEVYSSVTGEYIGGRVQETIKFVDYDTLWLHLSDVQGFTSVRVDDEAANMFNNDSVYINGQSTVLETKKVNPVNPASSRRFDVEMKEVWYVVASTEGGKTEYNLTKGLIPMLFVQTEQTGTFAADVAEKNSYMMNVSLPTANIQEANANYDSMQELFDSVKANVTYAEIQAFIGNKNAFFEAA